MANKYWFGTGNWSSSTNWFLDDAHTTGTTQPSTSDDVYFTANSSTGTCTFTTGGVCNNLDMTGFKGYCAGSGSMTMYGDLIFSGNTTYSGTLTLGATTLFRNITSNGFILGALTVQPAVSAGYVLQDDLTTTGNITFTRGSFDTNDKNLQCNRFISTNTSNIRYLNLSSSSINLSQFNLTSPDNNLFFSGGTSTIHLNGGGSVQLNGGNRTFYNVWYDGSVNSASLNFNNTFYELRVIQQSTSQFNLTVSGDQTITNNLVLSGSTQQNRIYLSSNLDNIQRTITCNGTISISDVDFTNIKGTGTTTWTGTRLGDGFDNDGITFDSPRTLYWVGISGGSWSDMSNWSLTDDGMSGQEIPRPQDSVYFTGNSIKSSSRTITIDCMNLGSFYINELLFNPTIAYTFNMLVNIFGNFILCTGYTHNFSTSLHTFTGRNNHFIKMFDKIISVGCVLACYGGSYTQQDIFDNTGGFLQLRSGSWYTNDLDFKTGAVSLNINIINGTGLYLGSSTVSLTSQSGNLWDMNSSNVSLSAGTSLIKTTSNVGGNIGFLGGGKSYYNVWFSVFTKLSYFITMSQNNSFYGLNLTPTSGGTSQFKFTDGTTQTLTGFTATGASGNLIKMTGTATAGWTFTKTGTGKTCCDYLDISGSTVNPINTFYAGVNSIDRGANVGWIFTSCSQIKSVILVLYASAISKVSGQSTSVINKILGLS